MNIGITGHQNLGDSTSHRWVDAEIASWLSNHHVDAGYSSLAMGADQVFASNILAKGIPLHVIIPCAGYEATFSDESTLARFKQLLSHAASKFVMPFSNPSEEAFWAAGRRIVEATDILLAVWDAQAAKGLGGTGDVVDYAKSIGKQVWHINPVHRSALFIDSSKTAQ